MGVQREQRCAEPEYEVLLQDDRDEGERDDRGHRSDDEPADRQQSDGPAGQTEQGERDPEAEIPPQRGRSSFPTPEPGEDGRDLARDGSQSAQVAGQRAADGLAGEPRRDALQEVDDQDRDASGRADGEADIRRSGVPRTDRSGVRTARETGGDQCRRDASNEVAPTNCECSESYLH